MSQINPKVYEKYKHLIGTQIYAWTILDIIVRGKDKRTYAVAQCHCGTIKEVRLSYILDNFVKDCGCEHKKRLQESVKKKYEHLIGTQINDWTILDIIPPDGDNHITFVKCQCVCGTIRNVSTLNLFHGQSKNCGCGRKRSIHEVCTKNLVGQRFGKLLVIKMLEERNNDNRIMYKCLCDCGNEVNVSGHCLTQKHTLSCGCTSSHSNAYINKLLTEKNIAFQPEYIVKINNKQYKFDFYLYDYNLFIEYDGEQHFMPVNFGGHNHKDKAQEEFCKTQERDNIKNKYCKDNHINLLRIPYWEKENIETIISNHLQRLNEKDFMEEPIKYATV